MLLQETEPQPDVSDSIQEAKKKKVHLQEVQFDCQNTELRTLWLPVRLQREKEGELTVSSTICKDCTKLVCDSLK